MVWGSFLIAAAALKPPTRNGFNAQGVNLTFRRIYRGDFRDFVLCTLSALGGSQIWGSG